MLEGLTRHSGGLAVSASQPFLLAMSQQPQQQQAQPATPGSPPGGASYAAMAAKKSTASPAAAAAAAGSSSSSSSAALLHLPSSSPSIIYSAPNSPPSVPRPSSSSSSTLKSSPTSKHTASTSSSRSMRRPGEAHSATPASASSSSAHPPSASPLSAASSSPHGVPGAFVLLPSAPLPMSQRPRSRSLGALHGSEFLSRQARKAQMAGKSRTATIQIHQAHAQLFANGPMLRVPAGRNNHGNMLSPPIEEAAGHRGGSDKGDTSSSPPMKSSTTTLSSPTYNNAGLPPRSGGGASGLTLPASSVSLGAKQSPLLSSSSMLGSSIFGPNYSDATSTTSVLGSGSVGGVGGGGVGSVLEMIPDLGGRAQSASSSLRRMPQSQSATSSPHASDNAFYPAELLEMGEIGIGTGDFLFPGMAGTAAAGGDSSYAAAGASFGSFAGMGLNGGYGFNGGSFAQQQQQQNDQSMVHPEGGRMAPPSLQSVGELDEIDMSLILMKLIHDRSNALEQRLTSRNRADGIYARERLQQQQQQQQQQAQQMHLANSTSSSSSSASVVAAAAAIGARLSAADRLIPQIPEEVLHNLSPPSSSPESAASPSPSPSPSAVPSPQPSLPPPVVIGSPQMAPQASPLPCPSPPSPAMSASSASSSSAASALPRFVVSELNLISRQMASVIALLYKSKLSLSLRTVQLRRHMREQFLSDLNHPARTQTSEDAEIARWIASSAFSNLEIADASQKNAAQAEDNDADSQQGDEEASEAEAEAAEGEGADDSDQEPLTGSPVDLTVSHTPKSSRHASVVYNSGDAAAIVAIPFPSLGSSSSLASGPSSLSSPPPPSSTLSPGSAAITTPATTPGAGPITPSTGVDAPLPAGSPTLPNAPSFPGPQHSPFSPFSSTGSPSPPHAASATSSASSATTTPNPPAHVSHAHGSMPATLYPPTVVASAASSSGSSAGNDRRSATPIILADETNISLLIGSGWNSSKRGSMLVPGSGSSQQPGPIPGTQIRRSSTSDPISAAKSSSATGSPLLLAKNRMAGSSGNLVGAAAASAASPALPSLNAGAYSPSMGAVGAQHQPPMTALALASSGGSGSDASSSTAAAARSVSHPSSPGPASYSLNAPSPGGPRCLSENKTPKKGESASTALIPANSPPAGAVGSSSSSHPAPPSSSRRHSRIYFTLSPAVTECLHSIWRWEFDIWEFAELVPDRPLTTITCFLLERWNLFQSFNIDRATFHRFIERIEDGYLANPYHNKIHAADVVQNIHVLLLGFQAKPSKDSSGALCTSLTALDVLACIIAAAIHDVGHTGTTNLFHTSSVSDLAITYNDVSVLENMSVSQTFELILRHKEFDIFASLSAPQRREIRETIIAMVLATDMKNHIGMLTDLQATVEQKTTTGKPFDVASRTDRLLLLKNCLHLSDVANPTKPTGMCVRWADAIVAEWFNQGDLELRLKLDISPMMDRRNAHVEKSQIGFIDFFITPLLATWVSITPQASLCQEYLKTNRAFWTARMQANEAAKMAGEAAASAAAAAATVATSTDTAAISSSSSSSSSSSAAAVASAASAVVAIVSPPPPAAAVHQLMHTPVASGTSSLISSAASSPNKKPLGS